MICNNTKPAISVDFKESRIRIHKTALRLIGDPKYIILLVNPEEHMLAVKPSDSSDKYAHRIRDVVFEDKHSFEIHSKMLLNCFLNMCDYWDGKNIYRMYGEYIASEGLVKFNMRDFEQDFENGLCDYD